MFDTTKLEEKILEFWQEKKIFEKVQKKNKGKTPWSFIDGPITANNPMGVHNVWGRTYKDLFQRYKAMQGFDQRFQNGFDCQGLWLEVEVEKDLGLNSKRDIEKFGLEKFSQKCKRRALKFAKKITAQSKRLGQWMDFENSYYTLSDKNIEYIWYFLKKCQEKGWLYKGTSVLSWCIRCGTSLSQHELLDSYKELTHPAVYIKCPIKSRKNEFLLIWTTTIWTLTSNIAVAVHPDFIYLKAKKNGEIYYLLKNRLSFVDKNLKVLKELKGKELLGLEYESPYQNLPIQKGIEHKVIPWREVEEEEGTGIVHIAPGCGAEDYRLAQELKMPKNYFIAPLDEFGNYGKGFGWLSGKNVKEVTSTLISDLKERGFLLKLEDYLHRYPVCWRCGEELVFRLVSEWFIKTDPIRPLMKRQAKKIKWSPPFAAKLMQDWLDNMQDWCISRKRYWGLPLPFYECGCGNLIVIESKKKLEELAENKNNVRKLPELHRPWIDQVKIKCPKCGKIAERVKEVGDCWLDAGIVPFSTLRYLEDKKYWQKWFPAEFICEMREQIRLWFYSLLFMSVTLEEKTPYKSVLVYEKVNDEKGRPMHKSLGNVIWFDEAVEEIGADAMRLVYLLQNPAFNLNFGYTKAKDVQNSFFRALYNSYIFFKTYVPSDFKSKNSISFVSPLSLDRWILSKLNQLIKKVTEKLDNLQPHLASQVISDFTLNDLSNWYIRRSRKREDKVFYQTLYDVLLTLTKLTAPFVPFISEEIYQELTKNNKEKRRSVHLEDWPKANEKLIDQKLNEKMDLVRKICEIGLAKRAEAKIKVRQPLLELRIEDRGLRLENELLDLIKEELNVKKVTERSRRIKGIKRSKGWVFKEENGIKIALNTQVTPPLKQEGYAREIVRHIQELRKEKGFKPKDLVSIFWQTGDKEIKKVFKKFEKYIKRETRSRELKGVKGVRGIRGKEVEIEGKNIRIFVEISN